MEKGDKETEKEKEKRTQTEEKTHNRKGGKKRGTTEKKRVERVRERKGKSVLFLNFP